MERNEVQGICVSYDSLSHETPFWEIQDQYSAAGGDEADPRLKDVPLATELRRPGPIARRWKFFARSEIGRPFVRRPAYRPTASRRCAALQEMLRDPAFLDKAKTQQLNVVPIAGKEILDIIAKAYQTKKEIVVRSRRSDAAGEGPERISTLCHARPGTPPLVDVRERSGVGTTCGVDDRRGVDAGFHHGLRLEPVDLPQNVLHVEPPFGVHVRDAQFHVLDTETHILAEKRKNRGASSPSRRSPSGPVKAS